MRVICFGEIMLRLSPPGYKRFVQASSFDVFYGGGEANVAVSLAGFGADAAFVTRLPEHEMGQAAVNELRRRGVDTRLIARGGERIGVYYCENGASQRPSKVIYDRAGSAFAKSTADDYDWDAIFNSADRFHFTGITPALGENVAALCMDACKAAKERGVAVSCDLNYRKKLWTTEKAGETMGELLRYVDLCIANEEDAEKVFGIKAEGADVERGVVSGGAYVSVARQIARRFGCAKVAITLRGSVSASENTWSGMLYDGSSDNAAFSRSYNLHIVDRVGGGDSFGAGLIWSLGNGASDTETVEFAAAASALKHSIEGDMNLVSLEEVQALVKGGGSGRVSR